MNSQKPDQYLASKFKGTDVVDSDDKKNARADQALADMARAEDAVRLALLQATEPLRAQDLCDLAAGTDQGMPLSNRSLDQARQRLVTLGEITTSRGTGRGTPLLHALNPDYVPDYAPDDDDGGQSSSNDIND